jgi:RNA polymerase sigma-70 factor (ECF subfamily)
LVDALPDKFRLPMILYYTLEMRVPDIAYIMKLPVGTVKSRLYKSRKLIEKGLGYNE